MRLTNWRNFSHPASYRRSLDDFFNDRYRNLLGMTGDFTPAMNTSEKKESYEIEVAAPGLKKDDFEITVNNGMLTITCDSSSEREEEDNHYVSREFSYHSFSRSFTLPTDVDDKHINARYEDGILHVRLPRQVAVEENEATRKVLIQ